MEGDRCAPVFVRSRTGYLKSGRPSLLLVLYELVRLQLTILKEQPTIPRAKAYSILPAQGKLTARLIRSLTFKSGRLSPLFTSLHKG